MSMSVMGIVGAGFMGSGIAESVAAAGKHALLYEPSLLPLERSREALAASLDKAILGARGNLTREDAARVADRVI